MSTLAKPGLLFLLAVLAPMIVLARPANVDAQSRPPQRPTANTNEKEKMNAWTVGLAGGLRVRLFGLQRRLLASSTTGQTCMSCRSSPEVPRKM